MSFVVTSNTPQITNGNNLSVGINRPFSYQNHLSSTMKIPANSEIAVQSVKINREGNISLNRQNNQFYYYNGQLLEGEITMQDTCNHPCMTWICDDNGQVNNIFDTDELASQLQKALRRALYYPHLQPSDINSSSASCSVKRNGSNLDFQGYNISVYSASSGDNASRNFPDGFRTTSNVLGTATFTAESNGSIRLTNNASGNRSSFIGTPYPLSLLNGSCIFDIQADKIGWEVGLSRCLRTRREDPTTTILDVDGKMGLEKPKYYRGAEPFFDYSAKCVFNATSVKNELHLFHAVWRDDGDGGYLQKRELNYGTKINLEDDNITKIAFNIQGERVKVTTINNTGTESTLVTGTNANKQLNFKPVSLVTANLYPRISMLEAGDFVQVSHYDGIKITNASFGSELDTQPFGSFKRQLNQDFWATQVNIGNVNGVCKEIESRYMFDYDDGQAYTQKGLNVSGGLIHATEGYFSVFILKESQLYTPTKYAGVSALLGFSNNGVLTGYDSLSNRTQLVSSTEVPKFLSTNSMFVRVKNLAHESFNFSKSSISKIIYHMPRFDNTGEEVGGLFFEPAERVYMDLNNPNDIMLNNLEVEIVNADETLATNLTGKTIVCFHIRKK